MHLNEASNKCKHFTEIFPRLCCQKSTLLAQQVAKVLTSSRLSLHNSMEKTLFPAQLASINTRRQRNSFRWISIQAEKIHSSHPRLSPSREVFGDARWQVAGLKEPQASA
jgi:hypothetical protein